LEKSPPALSRKRKLEIPELEVCSEKMACEGLPAKESQLGLSKSLQILPSQK
jgi:hypothetical protein